MCVKLLSHVPNNYREIIPKGGEITFTTRLQKNKQKWINVIALINSIQPRASKCAELIILL